MKTVLQTSATGVDLTQPFQIGDYTPSQSQYIAALVTLQGLSGSGGDYSSQVFIDDIVVVPDRPVTVPTDTAVRFQSRQILVPAGSLFYLKLQGLAGDQDVTVGVVLIDCSPTTTDEINDVVAPAVEQTIEKSIGQLKIDVHPSRAVLGPCKEKSGLPPRTVLGPCKEKQVAMPTRLD